MSSGTLYETYTCRGLVIGISIFRKFLRYAERSRGNPYLDRRGLVNDAQMKDW